MRTKGTFEVSNLSVRVRINQDLVRQIQYLVGKLDSECQWFHLVERIEEGNAIIFSLTEMFIPEQTVTGATVDSPASGMATLLTELTEKYGGFVAAGEQISKMQCWAHSHVNMEATPSGTDHQNYKELIAAQGHSEVPVIMMIVNKKDECFFKIYDPVTGLVFLNPVLEVVVPQIDSTYIDAAIKDKIKRQTYNIITSGKSYTPIRFGGETHSSNQVSLYSGKGTSDVISSGLETRINRKKSSFEHLRGDENLKKLLKRISTSADATMEAREVSKRIFSSIGNAAACFQYLVSKKGPESKGTYNSDNLTAALESLWSGDMSEYVTYLAASMVLYESYSPYLVDALCKTLESSEGPDFLDFLSHGL